MDVNGFPENAQQSGKWYMGYDWWWWRSSRVLADQDLLGNHIEVIDEFPMFSYVLGDNHPHVLAMPVVILVIGMALSVFLSASGAAAPASEGNRVTIAWRRVVASMPMGYAGLALVAVASGGLVFLNTWDYPPYLLLSTGGLFAGLCGAQSASHSLTRRDFGAAAMAAALFGMALVAATLAVYLPYFMTAQSQAGGFVPNLFNPSRLQQVMLMFGAFLPAIGGLLWWGWSRQRPRAVVVGVSAALVLGAPIAFLALSAALAGGTERGRALLSRMALPDGASSHMPFIVERWTTRPYTFLLFGLALTVCVAVVWAAFSRPRGSGVGPTGQFVLLVAGLAMLLVYAPEFVYLRDNFGTRMNTVFKFYYQAWLLMAIAAAYAVANALFTRGRGIPVVARGLAVVTLVLAAGALLFPAAGVYSKTMGFSAERPTLDATAYVLAENAAELGAVEWVRANTDTDDVVLEGRGASYRASHNRISAMTGRATLLGWEGHESQWRGERYGEMAGGRAELLELVYRTARADEIPGLLEEWGIDYVYVGPSERERYGVSPRSELRFAEAMDLVYDGDGVAIYGRR